MYKTKNENGMSLSEYKAEINHTLSKNLKYLMEDQGYNQSSLKNAFQQYGIGINQGTINKYLNKPDTNFIPVAVLIICSKIFNISLEKLITEDLNSSIKTSPSSQNTKTIDFTISKDSKSENNFISDANSRAFKGFWGKYYCYLFPTISSETKPLSGELTLTKGDYICKANLKLNTNKLDINSNNYIYKNYDGSIIISKPLRNCYCTLRSDDLGEFCFLVFRHIYLNNAILDCRMAEVLTVSAGESHYPTVHRMLLSREAISEKDLQLILPHLCLNSSDIIIKETDLNELKTAKAIPESALLQLAQTCEPELFYSFKEDYARSLLEHNLSKKEKENIQKYISFLRQKSLSYHYNKVSKKLDNNVRRLLISLGYFSKSKV